MADGVITKCPVCQTGFRGKLVLLSLEIKSITRGVVYESANRNWMVCELCKRILCKECGTNPEKSYCRPCREPSGFEPLPSDFAGAITKPDDDVESDDDDSILDEEVVF